MEICYARVYIWRMEGKENLCNFSQVFVVHMHSPRVDTPALTYNLFLVKFVTYPITPQVYFRMILIAFVFSHRPLYRVEMSFYLASKYRD